MNQKKNIDIACCLNSDFLVGFSAMVRSILDNLEPFFKLNLFIVHDNDVSDNDKSKIIESFINDDVALIWIKPNRNSLKGLFEIAHLKIQTYYRILLPRLLPDDINKVLYLDSDLVVTDNIADLWKLDLNGRKVAMSQDCNSGVMIMDLSAWRKDDTDSKILQFLRDYPEKCPLADNSAIIKIISTDERICFDNRWNIDPANIRDDITKFKGIIHFVGGVKPWHYAYPDNIYRKYFYQHLKKLRGKDGNLNTRVY